jgi:Fic family protein
LAHFAWDAAKIAPGTSQNTVLRDIDDLVSKGVLAKQAAGGRSTSYALVVDETTRSG